jgi:hypothetical protein
MRVLSALAVMLLLCCSAAQAVRLEQPYAVDVPVADQSAENRSAAERAGLLLVLEKLSGQRLEGNTQIAAAQNKAENFVAQFSYLQDRTADGKILNWRLRLVFEHGAIDKLLRDAAVTVWPLDRPQVLLIALDSQNHLLSASDGEAAAGIHRTSFARGVPLLLWDAAALDVATTASAQSLDTAALMPQAVQRGANALLLGNISGSDEKTWSGQWALRAGEQEQRFAEKAATQDALMDAALRHAADLLSTNYRNSTVTDAGSAHLRLQVDDVRSYAAFMQLRQYLEQLDAVEKIRGMQINGSTVMVDLDVKGRESFRNLFALFKSVQWREEVTAPTQNGDAAVWRYQWVE